MSGLEQARRRAGLTRSDVARFTVRTTQTVERWENGKTIPPKGVMAQLAQLYRVPLESLNNLLMDDKGAAVLARARVTARERARDAADSPENEYPLRYPLQYPDERNHRG